MEDKVSMPSAISTGIKLSRSFFRSPAYLVLYVTNRCDLSCPFCFNRTARMSKAQEMTLDEHIKLAKSCPHLFELLVSGGEPFLRVDLYDIMMAFVRYSKPGVIAIPTHGGHPDKIEDWLVRILPITPNTRIHINLSIDGIGADHDKLRGSSGLFDRIVETAQRVHRLKKKYSNLALGVNTVIGDHNRTVVLEIVSEISKMIHPDIHEVGLERDRIMKGPIEITLSELQDIHRVVDSVYPMSIGTERAVAQVLRENFVKSIQLGRPILPCLAGQSLLVVTADAVVYPCEPLWLEPENYPAFSETCFGNLRDYQGNLKLLLQNSKAIDIRQKINNRECRCFWECALFCSVLFSARGWLNVIGKSI
jgi:MoaA/NifB/PqqE/SkfB family radical SAM enzyme